MNGCIWLPPPLVAIFLLGIFFGERGFEAGFGAEWGGGKITPCEGSGRRTETIVRIKT